MVAAWPGRGDSPPRRGSRGQMTLLSPAFSAVFLIAVMAPLIVGLVVGRVMRLALKLGVIIVAVVMLLLVVGLVDAGELVGFTTYLTGPGAELTAALRDFLGYSLYASITFLAGVGIGIL